MIENRGGGGGYTRFDLYSSQDGHSYRGSMTLSHNLAAYIH